MTAKRRGLGSSLLLALFILCASSLIWSYWQTDAVNKNAPALENGRELVFPNVSNNSRQDGIGIPKSSSNHSNPIIRQRHEKKLRSPLVGLNCELHGGPSKDIASEMVYWEDIPSDSQYVSQFKKKGMTQYLTFEPDFAGWNNIRMGLETIIAMAYATGRTLVLPPEENFWILPESQSSGNFRQRRSLFTFSDFYPLESVAKEHAGLEIITMQEFLEREALTGNIRDKNGVAQFPPGNRTNWDRANLLELMALKTWLRTSMHALYWDPDKCMLVFPSSTNPNDIQQILDMQASVEKTGGFPPYKEYIGKPNHVNASALDRMKENWAEFWIGGKKLCIYDHELQNAHVLHYPMDNERGARLLVHFYAFLFFLDWRQDLWMKRFVRDHIRYIDSLQCTAARIVHALRERSRARGNPKGDFDSFHIRRTDFGSQFKETQQDAELIVSVSKDELIPNGTLYIATDEKNRSYFDLLREKYDVLFLDDFKNELRGIRPRYYGMVEQLVASRSRVFFGCWLSTFTNYINRLRGYHANKAKAPGYENGTIDSWYYTTPEHRDDMRIFYPVYQGYYFREFPTSWRLIDTGIDEMKEFYVDSIV